MEPEKAHPEFGPVIICPTEAIDFYSAWILRREITSALGPDTNGLIVSLEEVPFLDSSGLGVLVGAMKRARELGTSFHIVCPKESISRIFRVTGLDKVMNVHASVPDALAAEAQSQGWDARAIS